MWRAVARRKKKAAASPELPSVSYVASAAFQAGVSGTMADNQEEQPLSAGWNEAVTAEGEKYYVNHATKTTTWDRPTNQPETEKQQTFTPSKGNRGTIPITSSLAASTVEPDQKEPPLPAEWSEGVTTDGKKYYRNHVTKIITLDRPTTQPDTVNQAVPPLGNRGTIPITFSLAASTVDPDQKEPPLPEEWSEGVTIDGKKYYRNHVTKTTTWNRPTTQPDTVNQAVPPLDNGSITATTSSSLAVSILVSGQEEPPLPSGNGGTIPITSSLAASTVESDQKELPLPADSRGTIPITSSLAVRTVEPDQKEPPLPADNGSITATTSSLAVSTPMSGQKEPPLPSGWSEGFTTDGKKYYRNHVAMTTTWDQPTAAVDTPSATQATYASAANPAASPLGSRTSSTFSVAVTTTEADQKEDHVSTGWNEGVIVMGDGNKDNEYEAKTSKWDRLTTKEDTASKDALQLDNGSITATTTSLAISTPMSGQEEPPLPSGWSEGFTTGGKKYYRNHVAMTSTWDRPTAAVDTPPATQATYASAANPAASPLGSRTSSTFSVAVTTTEAEQKEDHVSTGWNEGAIVMGDGNKDNEYEVKTSKWDRLTTKEDTASKDALQLGSSSSTPHTTSSSYESSTFRNVKADQDESSLPRGWSERVTSDGIKYYINHITKTTTWDRPTAQAETANQAVPSSGGTDSIMHAANSEARGTAAEISPQGSSSSTPLATPSSAVSNFKVDRKVTPLFGGWSEGVMAGGKKYYINHITKIITWDRPTAQAETENQAVPSSGGSKEMRTASSVAGIVKVDKVDNEEPPLPSDWSERFMPDGEKFYVNHRLQITSWDRPNCRNQA